MTPFDRMVIVDWSARSTPSPRAESADAIWIGVASAGACTAHYIRTRAAALETLSAMLSSALLRGERVLVGVDFPLGYPAGFAEGLTGRRDPFAVWDWLARRIVDSRQNRNNRFAVADAINARFPGGGPLWGRPKARQDLPHLPWGKAGWDAGGLSEWRAAETLAPGARSVWQLLGNGSVGSQALTGLPVMAALRRHFQAQMAVWPFEVPTAPIVLAEVWPSLLAEAVGALQRQASMPIKDHAQVTLLAGALMAAQTEGRLPAMFGAARTAPPRVATPPRVTAPPQVAAPLQVAAPPHVAAPPQAAAEEGWILGVGAEAALRRAARGLVG